MPNPFRFYALRAFPDSIRLRPYVVPRQLTIGTADAEDTELSWRENVRTGSLRLDRLEIHHDVLIDSAGRVPVSMPGGGPSFIQRFNEYIATYHLEAYLTEESDLLAIEGPGRVVTDAVRTMQRHAAGITIAPLEVDFERLAPYLESIRGAWFSRKAGPLSSIALFGQAVTESPEWGEATLTSDIRTLMVQYEHDDRFQTITVTRDAGVVVYQNLNRDELLRLVFDAYESLIVRALKDPDFSGNREEPRG